MPFKGTTGEPNIARAIAEGTPEYVTRRETRRNDFGYHCHSGVTLAAIRQSGTLKHEWVDAVHRSRNQLFEVPKNMAVRTNVCIRNANDPSLLWRYEPIGPRQSARAYTKARGNDDPTHTRYVRIATRLKPHVVTFTFVHPAVAKGIMGDNKYTPPGDVVARWNQALMKQNLPEAERMHTILREGRPICVYFDPC